MTSAEKSSHQYQENSITSARPEDLTLMMYNGLMKFVARAQDEIREKNYEAAHNTLLRCQDIVFEFQFTLNLDYEVSNNLMLLYDFLYNRLIEANAKKDCGILDEVQGFVTELRDTWLDVMKLSREQKAAPILPDTASGVPAEAETASAGPVSAAAAPAGQAMADTGEANGAGAGGSPSLGAPGSAGAVPADIGETEGAAAASASNPPVGGLSSAKAIYSRNARPVGAPPVRQAPPQGGFAQPAMIFPKPVAPPPQAPPNIEKAPPKVELVPLPGAFEQAAAAARVLNNPMNRINPAAAAQYAKVSKAKNQPQENISIASK